jgi:iron(III) transport system ATP-binding protein
MAVSVRFDSITKIFGKTRALDNVSLAIEPGEMFFLLGPSGCGKTTLLRCLAGFCEPDAGEVWLGDRCMTRIPPHQRDTGMVFQSYALWPHMTVRENILFGLEMRDLDRGEMARRVDGVLEMVRMADRAEARPNQLSGGQQQRVALARALVVHPQCLLLDEPLSNLDARLRLEMRSEIRRICKEAGLTAIYVTHDQKEALAMADRMAILDAGRIRQIGTPEDIYRQPATTFVANFIGETNLVRGEVLAMDGRGVRVRTAMGEVLAAAGPGPAEQGRRVTLSIRPEAVRIASPSGSGPNLFEGRMHHSVYLGESAQHQVSLPVTEKGWDGPEVVLKMLELSPRVVARDDSRPVRIAILPEDVILLPE